MGCPDRYYKKALQAFAHNLNYFNNKDKASEMFNEANEEVLENEITRWKNSRLPVQNFYYEAGRISELILNNADKYDGCDGFNACIGGVYEFEQFIGVEDDE